MKLTVNDVDEARAIYARQITPIELEVLDRTVPFSWKAEVVALGPLTLSRNHYGAAVRGSTPSVECIYSVLFPSAGRRGAVTSGREQGVLSGVSGWVSSPLVATTVSLDSGYASRTMNIGQRHLEDAFEVLTGRRPRRLIQFRNALSLSAEGGKGLRRLLDFAFDESVRVGGVTATSAVALRLAESLMLSLLTAQPHSASAGAGGLVSLSEPAAVRRACEYLEAHLADPISLAELARVTQVSVRTLQAAFQRTLGVSPMEFLLEHRLLHARALLRSGAASTVTEVAIASGLLHLSRFSAAYRRRFNEHPSVALRRR